MPANDEESSGSDSDSDEEGDDDPMVSDSSNQSKAPAFQVRLGKLHHGQQDSASLASPIVPFGCSSLMHSSGLCVRAVAHGRTPGLCQPNPSDATAASHCGHLV